MISQYLYGAYGSNLNQSQMALRCPEAEPVGACTLKDYKLVFRGVADIVPSPGDSVALGLWRITERCEDALDIYEGFPKLYGKEFLTVPGFGRVMTYSMTPGYQFQPPYKHYLETIVQGYNDFGIGVGPLLDAIDHAWAYEGV